MRQLSDIFFAAGAVLTGFWALKWISATGFFDLFSYSFQTLRDRINPISRRERPEQFYAYKTRRAEKRKKPGNIMLYTGIGCIALSVLFLALFHRA